MAREVVRIEGLRGVLDTLKQLPPEIVSKSGGPVRFALRKAANVLRKEAQANVQRIIDAPNADGDPSDSTGLLKKSIIAGRNKLPPGIKGERFVVRVRTNRASYPDDRGKNRTAVQIGRQLEYGTEKRRPMPWMRPAFDAKKHAAVQTFVDEVKKRTQVVIDKIAKQNAGKS